MSISRARRSVNLPFPSSPHWVPTTTVAGTRLSVRSVASDYAPVYRSPKSGSQDARVSAPGHAGYVPPRGRGGPSGSPGRPRRGPGRPWTVGNELQDVRVAFVVANEGTEESELVRPWRAVVDAGGTAELIAPKSGMVETMRHLDRADRFPIDQLT